MWWLWLACGDDPSVLDRPAADPPVRPTAAAPRAVALARPGVTGTYTLPPASRPAAAADAFAIPGSFALEVSRPAADIYRIPLPIPPHLLPSMQEGTHTTGNQAPTGLAVRGPAGTIPFERRGRRPGTWGYDADSLFVGVEAGAAPPDASAYTIVFPKAAAIENSLNLAYSGLSGEAFARRTVTVGSESITGLLLPPPAEARFPLTVPAGGRLSFTPRLLPPSVPSAAQSDGADVEIAVVVDGVEQRLASAPVDGQEVRVDLSAHAGQALELVLRTLPRASPDLDYVLLGSPRVEAPQERPRRVVIVFVDTLRHDHLGFAGYPRPTSPTLDRLARNGTVFTEARTIAPWTLPSSRALLTGREPEAWSAAPTLAEQLGAAGFHTDALVTNAFLSQPFDLQRGWDAFEFAFQLPADQVVARGVEILGRHADQDELLLLHFMEPHLPYEDLPHTWAGAAPDGIALDREKLVDLRTDDPRFPAVRQHVIDRYDEEILSLDQALPPLFEAAGPEATIVLVSDHGEELWDHGSFEHGHTFYDELLRVPLVIRSPGLPPGSRTGAASLLDVVPTVCELVGVACAAADGTSLVPLAWQDAGAEAALDARVVPFGRPLYGQDGWGLLTADHKWWDRGGAQRLFDVSSDPGETRDLAATAPDLAEYPKRLAAALGREVRVAWRIDIVAPDDWRHDLGLYLSHPGGLAEAWIGFDPRNRGADIPPRVDENGRVSLEVPAGHEFPRTVWVVPRGDPYEVHGLVLSMTGRGVALLGAATGRAEPSADPPPFLTAAGAQFRVTAELGYVPTPTGGETPGYSPEMERELRALGYLDDEH